MKQLLTQALRDRLNLPSENYLYKIPGKSRTFEISASDIVSKLDEYRTSALPYMVARANLKIWLLNTVNQVLREDHEIQNPGFTMGTPFATEAEIEPLIEKFWPSSTAASFLRDFFGNQGRIFSAALQLDFTVKELSLLQRSSGPQLSTEVWSPADVALLDYLEAQLIGQNQLFDYIVVDEAQDMSPMQIDSIRRRSSTGDILLLGDLAQGTGSWIYSGWDKIAEILGEEISRFDELEFGYRVPKQIFEYATRVLTYIDPELQSPRLVRDVPQTPTIEICSGFDNLVSKLIADIKQTESRGGLIGIIATDEHCEIISMELARAQIDFHDLLTGSLGVGLNLVPVSRQKGLEFDSVILIDPKSITKIPKIGLRQLYVALSRALRSLRIYAVENLPIELLQTSPSTSRKKIEPSKSPAESKITLRSSDISSVLEDVHGYLTVKGIGLNDFNRFFSEYLSENRED
jgi:superfamily I DNA/RNA helicase